MKLQSSEDFGKTLMNETNSGYRRKRNLYDKFIEQPLKLEMFVPCDEDGNVLNQKLCDFSKYQQAKEKVLFEGFEKRIKDKEVFKQHLVYTKTIKNTIEWDLTLTPNATKQFLK